MPSTEKVAEKNVELGPGSSGRSLSEGQLRAEDPINAPANDTDRLAAVATVDRRCFTSVSRLQRESQIKERERAKIPRHAPGPFFISLISRPSHLEQVNGRKKRACIYFTAGRVGESGHHFL